MMNVIQNSKTRDYWPTGEWKKSSPVEQHVNPQILNGVTEYLQNRFPYNNRYVVIRNGYLIFESHNSKPFENILSIAARKVFLVLTRILKSPNDTFRQRYNDSDNLRSTTKSIMSILIGIALENGLIPNLDEKIEKYFPEYFIDNKNEDKKNITIRNLLMMKSGLANFDKGTAPFKLFFLSRGKWVDFIFRRPMAGNPGEDFDYNSANTHILSAIISRVSGRTTMDFANEYLFSKLGIKEVHWEQDAQGVNFGGGNLFMNTYDLAKIAFLFLNNGEWDSKQIIRREWIEETLTSYHEWLYGYHYGYLWYMKIEKSEVSGNEFLVYSTAGAGGQKILIVPELDIIVAATSTTSLVKDISYHIDLTLGKYIFPAVIK